MRNSKTHSITLKKKLEKSQSTFIAYNELQYAFGIKLDSNPNIVEIQFNVKLKGCPEGEHYTPGFCCTKTNVYIYRSIRRHLYLHFTTT